VGQGSVKRVAEFAAYPASQPHCWMVVARLPLVLDPALLPLQLQPERAFRRRRLAVVALVVVAMA